MVDSHRFGGADQLKHIESARSSVGGYPPPLFFGSHISVLIIASSILDTVRRVSKGKTLWMIGAERKSAESRKTGA